jgi:23S rRNA pseudouridine1911/1915/1917 synthase
MHMLLIATTADVGERVDAFIARGTDLPRARVQAALRAGELTVNGRAVRPSYRLEAGDEIAGDVSTPERSAPQAEDIFVAVRYEDDRVLVVSKPAGMVTHPGHGNPSGTLVNALLARGHSLSQLDPERPGIVHRLDKDTSGLLLVAKDDDAQGSLADAMQQRRIDRRYAALVRGSLGSVTGTIDAPVGRHPVRRQKMAVVPGGRSAVTHYEVLDSNDTEALLELKLETGRTHQIRVHLSHLGHPVLGDPTYGGKSDRSKALGLTRPFLHAWRLAFPHPEDGRLIEVEDPLPPDLEQVLAATGLKVA